MQTFRAGDDAGFSAFLAATPRALVLFRGTRCPYSATFRPHFEAAEGETPGWALAVRDLAEADDAAWRAHGIAVTPTVVAFVEGEPAARLPGRLLLGLTRQAFAGWRARLP